MRHTAAFTLPCRCSGCGSPSTNVLAPPISSASVWPSLAPWSSSAWLPRGPSVQSVEPDDMALRFIREAGTTPVRIIANRPDTGLPEEYDHKLREASESHHLPGERVLFLEVRPGDVSEFSGRLRVGGVDVAGHHVLRCVSPAIPNAIAALLLYIRDETGRIPHAYFGWTEGNPIAYLLKFLAFGEGDTAPVTREVLRQSEPSPMRRPRIHVG